MLTFMDVGTKLGKAIAYGSAKRRLFRKPKVMMA